MTPDAEVDAADVDADAVAFAGLTGQARLLAGGGIDSAALVRLLLARIARLDPVLHAFREVLADRARSDAAAADAARAAGDPRPLLGVPIAVKDVVDVAGVPTRHGTGSPEPPAATDGELVTRLRAAGLVLMGKTTLPELALWGTTASPWTGVTRNPWRLDRTPGGSSGGSAAAVAAGLVPAAHATDGLGSIRIPAACCGLVGLKPTAGLVPLDDGDHWQGLSRAGFLTRSVADTVALLAAVSDRAPAPVRPLRLTVGVSRRGLTPVPLHPQVRVALDRAVRLLADAGHAVRRVDLPRAELTHLLLPRYLRGVATDLQRLVDPRRTEPRTRRLAAAGRRMPDGWVSRAREDGDALADRLAATTFSDVDVLVSPTTATPPIAADAVVGRGPVTTLLRFNRFVPFTQLWNVTGQPALAIPAGWSGDGLPLGVQLVGRRGADATLLALAADLEARLDWTRHRPPLPR